MGQRLFPSDSTLKVILLVEDDELIRGVLCDFLTEAGFRVLDVANAADAVQVISSHGDPRIDLLVTDVNMPGAMDGLGLAHWLADVQPALPVIITSGFVNCRGERGDRRRFVPKPYKLEELEHEIRGLLN